MKDLKVFIQGSCVSRDAIEFKGEKDIKLVRYGARSSFAIFPLRKLNKSYKMENLVSAFQLRMLNDDHERNLLKHLRVYDFDVVLIDLIDERFNLVNLDGNGYVTYSNEFKKTGQLQKAAKVDTIRAFTNKHRFLILQGFEIFFEKLRAMNKENCCYLNAVYLAKFDELGNRTPESEEYINRVNEFLSTMYQAIKLFFPEINLIEYDEKDFVAKSNHKWGCAPFHYVDDLYYKTLDKLCSSYNIFNK